MADIFASSGVVRRTTAESSTIGIHLVTPPAILYGAVSAFFGPDSPRKFPKIVVDAGSGQCENVLRLAGYFRQAKIIGVELIPELHDEGVTMVNAATRHATSPIPRDQIECRCGNFNLQCDDVFRAADLVYYFANGTRDATALAETISRLLPENAAVLEVGLISQLQPRLQWRVEVSKDGLARLHERR